MNMNNSINSDDDEKIYQKAKIPLPKQDRDNNGVLDKEEVQDFIREEYDRNLSFTSLNQVFNELDFEHKDKRIDVYELYTTNKYLENHHFRRNNIDFLSQITNAMQRFKQDYNSLLRNMLSKLRNYQNLLNAKDERGEYYSNPIIKELHKKEKESIESLDPEFKSAFSPVQMRCIALVSHNEMKATMKKFVVANKNLLKHFRLTGTRSTMTMLRDVFQNDPEVVFGASCESGPLGGDAQLVAQICSGCLGGVLFFEDPMESHAHSADIECLNRQALIHNVMIAHNPTSALMMMSVLREALKEGKGHLIPSFFFSLESPSVYDYKQNQEQDAVCLNDQDESNENITTLSNSTNEEQRHNENDNEELVIVAKDPSINKTTFNFQNLRQDKVDLNNEEESNENITTLSNNTNEGLQHNKNDNEESAVVVNNFSINEITINLQNLRVNNNNASCRSRIIQLGDNDNENQERYPYGDERDEEFERLLDLCKRNIMRLYHERTNNLQLLEAAQ